MLRGLLGWKSARLRLKRGLVCAESKWRRTRLGMWSFADSLYRTFYLRSSGSQIDFHIEMNTWCLRPSLRINYNWRTTQIHIEGSKAWNNKHIYTRSGGKSQAISIAYFNCSRPGRADQNKDGSSPIFVELTQSPKELVTCYHTTIWGTSDLELTQRWILPGSGVRCMLWRIATTIYATVQWHTSQPSCALYPWSSMVGECPLSLLVQGIASLQAHQGASKKIDGWMKCVALTDSMTAEISG